MSTAGKRSRAESETTSGKSYRPHWRETRHVDSLQFNEPARSIEGDVVWPDLIGQKYSKALEEISTDLYRQTRSSATATSKRHRATSSSSLPQFSNSHFIHSEFPDLSEIVSASLQDKPKCRAEDLVNLGIDQVVYQANESGAIDFVGDLHVVGIQPTIKFESPSAYARTVETEKQLDKILYHVDAPRQSLINHSVFVEASYFETVLEAEILAYNQETGSLLSNAWLLLLLEMDRLQSLVFATGIFGWLIGKKWFSPKTTTQELTRWVESEWYTPVPQKSVPASLRFPSNCAHHSRPESQDGWEKTQTVIPDTRQLDSANSTATLSAEARRTALEAAESTSAMATVESAILDETCIADPPTVAQLEDIHQFSDARLHKPASYGDELLDGSQTLQITTNEAVGPRIEQNGLVNGSAVGHSTETTMSTSIPPKEDQTPSRHELVSLPHDRQGTSTELPLQESRPADALEPQFVQLAKEGMRAVDPAQGVHEIQSGSIIQVRVTHFGRKLSTSDTKFARAPTVQETPLFRDNTFELYLVPGYYLVTNSTLDRIAAIPFIPREEWQNRAGTAPKSHRRAMTQDITIDADIQDDSYVLYHSNLDFTRPQTLGWELPMRKVGHITKDQPNSRDLRIVREWAQKQFDLDAEPKRVSIRLVPPYRGLESSPGIGKKLRKALFRW